MSFDIYSGKCFLNFFLKLRFNHIRPAQDDDPHLLRTAALLQLNAKELRKWLCHRRIVSMKETFDKPMNSVEVSANALHFLVQS